MQRRKLEKVASGVNGLDEVCGGGLPAGRTTLIIGGPGAGKTLLGAAFLVRGALEDQEPGVLVSFDERGSDLEINTISLGWDLVDLQKRNLLVIEHVQIDRQQIIEAGEYDLEGLFIRLAFAVDTVKARRVVLDSIDTLFASVPNEAVLRAELRRLFAWLKDRGLSAIVTGERGDAHLSRHGIEEYVSDCVILLDSRLHEEVATRRLRVVKYRGTAHGSNEYPFLIEESGITVLPVTSLGLTHTASDRRVSSGSAGLDDMLSASGPGGASGFFKGSSVLISGGPGAGKTSFAGQFAAATCARGERCLYFAFEESQSQLVRDMRAIGVDLAPHIEAGRLEVRAVRPTLQGLETHLATMLHRMNATKPDAVVIDPLSALAAGATHFQARMMVLRLIDYVKAADATAVYTAVGDQPVEIEVSSMMDTWITLENRRRGEELERRIFIVKSRGMPHSSELREFTIGAGGLAIRKRALRHDG